MPTSRRHFLAGPVTAWLASRANAAPDRPQFFSQYDSQVHKLLPQMTLDEKIGQMTQPDQKHRRSRRHRDRYFSARC